jgi:hypothetical protein
MTTLTHAGKHTSVVVNVRVQVAELKDAPVIRVTQFGESEVLDWDESEMLDPEESDDDDTDDDDTDDEDRLDDDDESEANPQQCSNRHSYTSVCSTQMTVPTSTFSSFHSHTEPPPDSSRPLVRYSHRPPSSGITSWTVYLQRLVGPDEDDDDEAANSPELDDEDDEARVSVRPVMAAMNPFSVSLIWTPPPTRFTSRGGAAVTWVAWLTYRITWFRSAGVTLAKLGICGSNGLPYQVTVNSGFKSA